MPRDAPADPTQVDLLGMGWRGSAAVMDMRGNVMRGKAVLLGGLAAVSLAAAGPARADGPSLLEETLACRTDVMSLCADKVPDREAIIACLKQNRRRLTPQCGPVFDAGLKAHDAGTQ